MSDMCGGLGSCVDGCWAGDGGCVGLWRCVFVIFVFRQGGLRCPRSIGDELCEVLTGSAECIACGVGACVNCVIDGVHWAELELGCECVGCADVLLPRSIVDCECVAVIGIGCESGVPGSELLVVHDVLVLDMIDVWSDSASVRYDTKEVVVPECHCLVCVD